MSDTNPSLTVPDGRHEDRGATLVLVLLLVVVAGLVVVPLMNYTTSVLRLNTAVSERTQDVEASKAGLRVALTDPDFVFTECDDGGSLGAITVGDTLVTTTCQELQELGPLDALGYEVPIGVVATQLGAEAPATASGGTAQSDPVPSYPATADWWSAMLPVAPDEPWDTRTGSIWMPELPRWPAMVRTPTPFAMPFTFNSPSGIECRVFFPGHYDQPVTLDGTYYYYFASGVYYFEEPITVTDNADVVVGYGLEDFEDRDVAERSPCADDLQVATSVVSGPAVFAIDGGGATWVLGDNARLIVDDSTGSPSIRFNQRYSEEDRGGRVSIMTVNGVLNGTVADPHDVTDVNYIPASQELDTYDTDNDLSNAAPINATQYVPSCGTATGTDCEFTDAARLPAAPALTVTGEKYQGSPSVEGAARITWNEPIGNDTGGALIDGYVVTIDGNPVCDGPGEIVYLPGNGPSGENQLSCYSGGLSLGGTYSVTVAATNAVGEGPVSTTSLTVPYIAGNDDEPDPVGSVTLEETDVDDVARVVWTAPATDGGAPITGYEATIERLFVSPQPDENPRALGGYAEVVGTTPLTTRVPAVDPNGGAITIAFDTATIPAGWAMTHIGGVEVLITPPTSGAPTRSSQDQYHNVDYTVSDTSGNVAAGTMTVAWLHAYDDELPNARSFRLRPEVGTGVTSEVAAYHPHGDALTVSVNLTTVDTSVWTVTVSGTEITIETTLTDGSTINIPYSVKDAADNEDSSSIEVIAPTATIEVRGTCSVDSTPWYETEMSCDVAGLGDLIDPSELGYRATVTATNAVGTSTGTDSSVPYPRSFDGGGTASSPAPERVVHAWTPEPIIDIRAGSAGSTRVRIGGYVSVPMGRIRVDNPDTDDNDTIEIMAGVIAGTFDIDDPDTIVGVQNDIVLQRKIRVVSTAGNATSTAVIQINEDGAAYAINSWTVG